MTPWRIRAAETGDGQEACGEQAAWSLVAVDDEDLVVGGVRVRRRIGLDWPRPWYHVGSVVHAARDLQLFHRQRTLLLGNDHTGASELADLACDAQRLGLAEQAAVLQLLVRAALLLIARERAAFAPQLIVELPGVRDAAGQSPFWQGLGRHFYDGDPQQVAQALGPAWRTHLAALMPRHPIVASFLPEAAQAAIAQARPSARVQMDVLAAEGLRYGHHVCIDDAGPVYEGHLDTLAGVLQAGRRTVRAAGAGARGTRWLVAHATRHAVQVVQATESADGQVLSLAPPDLAQLGLAGGGAAWMRRLG